MTKNNLADVIWRRQEREIWEGIQTTIDTSPDIIVPHVPPQEEENMPENHSRRRLGISGCRMNPHAPPEKRVSVETAARQATHQQLRVKKNIKKIS